MRVFLKVLSFIILITAITGCTMTEEIKKDVRDNERSARKALEQIEPSKEPSAPLIVDDRPWYGAKAVPVSSGDPLPAKFNSEDSLIITFSAPMSIDALRTEIQKVTGLRVIVDRTSSEGRSSVEQTFLPPDGLQVTGGRVVWQGSLEKLLNQMGDAFDAGWSYKNGTVRIYQEVTKTFMLHALATTVSVGGSLESGSSDTGNLPEVSITDTTQLEIWSEIEETLQNIVDARGRISMSPSTGTITVSASPTLVARVEEYLRQQNALRLRRVAVAVKVLSVEVTDSRNYGFDLLAEFADLIEDQPYRLINVDGSLTAGIIQKTGAVNTGADSGSTFIDDFQGTISASESVGDVTVSNSGAIITLSDQPAPLQIGRQIAYLERVSSTTSDGSSGVSLEPGTIDVGLTMNILPRVIENDRVLMRLGVAITDVEEPFDTFSSSDATIQLPQVDTTGFLQNAVISQGETLVLAGFERQQSGVTDQKGLSFLFGGTRTLDKNREITVLLITAEILPEQPLTILENFY